MGEDHMVKWVSSLKTKYRISFIAIQETQLSDAEKIDVSACWGSNDFGVDRTNSLGEIWWSIKYLG